MENNVIEVKRNEKGFAYIEFCSGSHGHIKTRIWVSNQFITKRERIQSDKIFNWEELQFPVKNAIVHKTEKGGLVFRAETTTVYYVQIPSGYRGSASIDKVDGGEIIANGIRYHSGQGNLGETAWAIINGSDKIVVRGTRTGRRVDKTEQVFELKSDGTIIELIDDEEIEAILA